MILAITDKCSMGCSHCLSDCSPDLGHTTFEQFKKNLEWCFNPKLFAHPILISGGEPFEHPEIKNILEYTAERYNKIILSQDIKMPRLPKQIVVITNGLRLVEDFDFCSWYRYFTKKNSWLLTQITNVEEYYPITFTDKENYWLSKIHGAFLCNSINDIALYPQGRALNLDNPDYKTKGPKCANVRMLAKQLPEISAYELFNAIAFRLHKFCELRINIDGSISIGESRLCPPIGTVDDSEEALLDSIHKFNCSSCKISIERLKNNSPAGYELFIGDNN